MNNHKLNDGEGGHVVIIDALKKSVRTYDVYYFYNGVLSYHHTVTQTTWQIGINWGWNGNGDSISGQPVWYDITGDITNSYYDITYDTIKRILY